MNNDQPFQPEQTWETCAKAAAIPGSEPSELILGEVGQQQRVVFVGDPWCYEACWSEDDGWVPWESQNPAHAEITPALRVRLNVWLVPDGCMRWWEMSAATFRVLLRFRDRCGRDGAPPFDAQVFQIERMGSSSVEPIHTLYESSGMTPQLHASMQASPRYALHTCGRHSWVPDKHPRGQP